LIRLYRPALSALSSSTLPGGAVPRRLQFQIGYQEQVDDIERVIGLADNDGSAARDRHDELAMADRDRSPVRKVDDERTKGLGIIGIAELLDRHLIITMERPRETRSFRHHEFNPTVTHAALANVLSILNRLARQGSWIYARGEKSRRKKRRTALRTSVLDEREEALGG
jgi:hypothetical protein